MGRGIMQEKIIGVNAVKTALSNIESVDLSPKEVLTDSIDWLYDRYSVGGDERYLKQALNHIQAYVQLGFPYEDNEQIFDRVLTVLKVDRVQVLFLDEKYTKMIKLNKNQIRGMIRKWNPHIHSMTINSVIEDVMDKVKGEKSGIYTYASGKKNVNGKSVPKDEYRLLIYGEKAQFFDVTQKLYYTIEKG